MSPDRSFVSDLDAMLLAGLRPQTRAVVRQLLLYKSLFLSQSLRELADEEAPDVADVLRRLHHESVAEAAAIALAMREWDALGSDDDKLAEVATHARRRFLADLLLLKESVVDVGLGAAMRAPTAALRTRLVQLADLDRAHADDLRNLLGAPTISEHARAGDRATTDSRPIGVGTGRAPHATLRAALQEALEDVRQRGTEPLFITLSPEAARHARDEGLIDRETGRAFGLSVDIDMAWRGECFAIETQERVSYAELITRKAR